MSFILDRKLVPTFVGFWRYSRDVLKEKKKKVMVSQGGDGDVTGLTIIGVNKPK